MKRHASQSRRRPYSPRPGGPRLEQLEPRLALSSQLADTSGFTASIELPQVLSRHGESVIYVDYSNQGSTAINAPMVTLHGTQHSLLSMYPPSGKTIHYFDPPSQYSSTVSFLATGNSATPTVLQPGESMRIPVYYVGQQRPWDFSKSKVDFTLKTSDQSETTPLDVSQFQAAFEAEGYSAKNAQQYATATRHLLGDTVGGLVTYADTYGTTPTSLQDLIDSAEVAATYQVFGSSAGVSTTAPANIAAVPLDQTGNPIQSITTYVTGNGPPSQYIFLVKGYHDGAADSADAQKIVDYYAGQGRDVEVLTVDWSNAAGANGSVANVTNYNTAAQNALHVGDGIAQYMVDNGIPPGQTIIAGHSLGAQAAGEAGQQIQNLTGEKLSEILAADAAGPGFSGRDPNQRLDPTDASKVVDVHTTQSLGDSDQIGTIDQYVRNASVNPVTAHTQAWDLLMQSMTDPTMKTADGQGFGANADTPGVQNFGNQGPIHFLAGHATNLALHGVLLAAGKGVHPTATSVGQSFDPNDLVGPTGPVTVGSPLDYRIDFENAPKATAPAQHVVINEHLDSHFDLSSFQFTGIQFGSTTVPLTSGEHVVNTTVPITANGKPLDVQISASVDAKHHALRIEFDSLDPSTGLPPDVLTGFLPPEDGSGRGLADVTYSVQLNPHVHAGTHIQSAASISFDSAPAHKTNRVNVTVAS